MTAAAGVIVAREGAVGRLRLDRPRALHALTHPMCAAMADALLGWREDAGIELVLIDHAPASDGDPKLSRGFCAGGDVRAIWDSANGDGAAARAFFFDEYRLNHLLFVYAKPIVAVMDGIVMGGGVGLAAPARFRIATERTVFAMPETGIGLFPDVGGGWHLARLPGRIGEYLAATGARIDGADCAALGLATHYVPSAALDALKADLVARLGEAGSLLAAAAVAPPPAPILAHRAAIDRLFAGPDHAAIRAALAAEDTPFAQATAATLAAKSPQAVAVALRQLAQARTLTDFADEMRMEYRLAVHVVQRNDFREGVRALLVDRSNDPRWDPATPDAVTDHLIDTIFAPLAGDEEWTPYRL